MQFILQAVNICNFEMHMPEFRDCFIKQQSTELHGLKSSYDIICQLLKCNTDFLYENYNKHHKAGFTVLVFSSLDDIIKHIVNYVNT